MTDTPDDTTPAEAIEAAQKSLHAAYLAVAEILAGQVRYAVEAAAPLIAARAAATERQRITRLLLDPLAIRKALRICGHSPARPQKLHVDEFVVTLSRIAADLLAAPPGDTP